VLGTGGRYEHDRPVGVVQEVAGHAAAQCGQAAAVTRADDDLVGVVLAGRVEKDGRREVVDHLYVDVGDGGHVVALEDELVDEGVTERAAVPHPHLERRSVEEAAVASPGVDKDDATGPAGALERP
jgi:hypothetical protein